MRVRCKFVLDTITEHRNWYDTKSKANARTLKFVVVHKGEDNAEDTKFWEASPSGSFELTTVLGDVAREFELLGRQANQDRLAITSVIGSLGSLLDGVLGRVEQIGEFFGAPAGQGLQEGISRIEEITDAFSNAASTGLNAFVLTRNPLVGLIAGLVDLNRQAAQLIVSDSQQRLLRSQRQGFAERQADFQAETRDLNRTAEDLRRRRIQLRRYARRSR